MACNGCSALHGVNPNLKKENATKHFPNYSKMLATPYLDFDVSTYTKIFKFYNNSPFYIVKTSSK